jgi:TPR repeat protein
MNILESWNLKQSQAGDICATFNLAMHYQYYQSLNMKESFKLLNQAADAGLAEAEYWLGNAYYLGEKGILEKDPKKAAQLWSNAASKGFPDAIYKVANMHRLGEIYPKNLKIAKDLFLQCDKYGNPLCAYWYARMLLEDDKPDVKEALKYLEKITQTSIVYGEAQLTIGKILIDTTNIEEFNLTGGIKSLRSATLLANNAEAALILSKIYYDNRLISIDLTESYRWLCAYQKIKQDVGIEFEIPEDVFAMKSHIEISIGSDAAEKIKTDAITILKK